MTLADQFKNTLLEELRGGKKQTQLAKEHNVSQQYISTLLSAEHDCEGVSLGIVSKMFPRATLNLNGDGNNTITQVASNVKVNTQSINNGSPPGSAEQARTRIIAALIPLDIPPESLQAVLRTINELDLN